MSVKKLEGCVWETTDPLYIDYHDHEWGRIETDSQALFAKLCLDGQQAGLSWLTILKRREGYETLFQNFDPEKIVQMGEEEILHLLTRKEIIRHRGKIESIRQNAEGYLALLEKGISFYQFIWQFSEYRQIENRYLTPQEVPTSTKLSRLMAKELKGLKFSFVGETICYAFMQAVGIYNDHLMGCPRHEECCGEPQISL